MMKGLILLGGLIGILGVLAGVVSLVLIGLVRVELLWVLLAGVIGICCGSFMVRRAIRDWHEA